MAVDPVLEVGAYHFADVMSSAVGSMNDALRQHFVKSRHLLTT